MLGISALDGAGEPILTEERIDEILAVRTAEPSEENPQRFHETWLLAEGLVTLAEMKALVPYITSRGSAYRAQVVGYFDQGGPAARIETVIDATTATPRIVFWRDITHLGPGYATDLLGVETRE